MRIVQVLFVLLLLISRKCEGQIHEVIYGDTTKMTCTVKYPGQRCVLKDNLIDGLWIVYSDIDKNKLIYKANYKNNVRHGYCLKYYESGELMDSSFYVNGKEHGLHFRFFKNGKLNSLGEYDSNRMINQFNRYDSLGNLELQDLYSSEGNHIKQSQYYKNQTVKSDILAYPNGEELAIEYYENGKIRSLKYFINGNNKTGTWTYFNEDGILTRKETYVKDELISE